MQRKIVHIDMDAFFASIEQRDDKTLRGKPVVVGGKPNSRGVVCAASYEARRFGIRSAMPCSQAFRLCNSAIFVPPRFEEYRSASRTVMDILSTYSDLVEPLSLDEAYLDVTENKRGFEQARHLAAHARQEIFQETALTASAGVAPNKFLAKIASDLNKPNGMAVIPPQKVEEFLRDLAVRKVPGVGKVTEQKMIDLGITTVGHLREKSLQDLEKNFGKTGAWFHRIARGIDEREVSSNRERKSLSVEDTFRSDLSNLEELQSELEKLSFRLDERLKKRELCGYTLTLKVTYADFEKITRSFTNSEPYTSQEVIFSRALELLDLTAAGERPIRLLGVGVSKFESEEFPLQLKLQFSD